MVLSYSSMSASECAWISLPCVESTGRRFQWELSGQRLIKNCDYLLEVFFRIEQWPSQCVVKSSVVATIIRLTCPIERVYIFRWKALWSRYGFQADRGVVLSSLSHLLEGGTYKWCMGIIYLRRWLCVYKRPFSHQFIVGSLSEFKKTIDKIMESAMT